MARARKPRNAALEFAKAFTYLVAREGARLGKKRTLNACKFEKWARSTIRTCNGDPDRIGEAVGVRLHWLIFDQRRKWTTDVMYCIWRGGQLARRHKVLIAEQVLTEDAGSGTFGLVPKNRVFVKAAKGRRAYWKTV